MKKRICGLLLALLLLFSLVPLSAAADATALTASDVSVAHGTAEKTVSISVGISGNPGIAAFDFHVNAGEPLGFQSVTLSSALGSEFYSANGAHVTYVDGEEYSGSALFTVTYSIPANAAAGSYPVTVSIEAYRFDETPVQIPAKTVYVNVTHDLVKTDAVPATCEADGTAAYWTCSVCGAKFADANGQTEITAPAVIPKLGHAYDSEPTYTWADDYSACTATLRCSKQTMESCIITEEAIVTSAVKTPPQCGSVGTTTYTATFTNTAFATQTKDVDNIPAVGTHTWGAPAWSWTGNDADGYTEAAATFECTTCHETQTIPVTPAKVHTVYCDAPGSDVYTATVTGPDSQSYSDVKTVVLDVIGHEWTVSAAWTGSDTDGYTAAAVTYTCQHGKDGPHTVGPVNAAVTSAPDGSATVYTATVDAAAAPAGVDASLLTVTKRVGGHTPGDINGNGEVDISDVVILARYVAGGNTGKYNGRNLTFNPEALDVSGNGEVDIGDVVVLARYVAGGNTGYYNGRVVNIH